jgi:hypothetical protein
MYLLYFMKISRWLNLLDIKILTSRLLVKYMAVDKVGQAVKD